MLINGNGNSTRSWTEYFRIITPFLLLILTWLGGGINSRLDKIDNKIDLVDTKLFHHLTNADLHLPRSEIVTCDQFNIYLKMYDEKNKSFEKRLDEIRDIVKKIK